MPAVLATTDDGIQLHLIEGATDTMGPQAERERSVIGGVALVMQVVPNAVFLFAAALLATKAGYLKCRSNEIVRQINASIASRVRRLSGTKHSQPGPGGVLQEVSSASLRGAG